LIDGKIFEIGSSPSTNHQKISGYLVLILGNYLINKNYHYFSAPFDVRLPRISKDNKEIITIVQPDLCVICDASKLDVKGCLGAPDIVVEILSSENKSN